MSLSYSRPTFESTAIAAVLHEGSTVDENKQMVGVLWHNLERCEAVDWLSNDRICPDRHRTLLGNGERFALAILVSKSGGGLKTLSLLHPLRKTTTVMCTLRASNLILKPAACSFHFPGHERIAKLSKEALK